MFKEQMNKIKDMFSKKTENGEKPKSEKRKIENLIVFLIILIVTLIAINTILKGNDKNTLDSTNNPYKELAEVTPKKNEEKQELEGRLENILGKMVGVGSVNVLITYSQTSEVVAMYNENTEISHTSEEDSAGRK